MVKHLFFLRKYTIPPYWTADIQLICIIALWQVYVHLNVSDNRYYSIR